MQQSLHLLQLHSVTVKLCSTVAERSAVQRGVGVSVAAGAQVCLESGRTMYLLHALIDIRFTSM
jgi:ActR/RegA family two-component response regulator